MDYKATALGEKIMRDVSVGILAINFKGVIWYVNDAACLILGKKKEALENRLFATSFFDCPENDAFSQMVMNAISDKTKTHQSVVDYHIDGIKKEIHVETSFSVEHGERLGIIAVISDVTEIVDMKASLENMNHIKELNDKLEIRNKLLGDTFGRYLSDAIVRQILDSPNGLQMGGQKKHMTVMMSDLRGFTRMCESMSAQNLVLMINHYLGEMTTVISSFKGTIIEFLGDGILAIFGAPIESHSHASDAMGAALAMQLRMQAVNAWNIANGFPNLKMGIGICTGDMIVGNIGSERHAKYGVLGSNVNLCGRIESYTTEGQIYVSDATLNEANCKVEVEESIEINAKGVKEKLIVHRINGLGSPYNLSYINKPDELKVLEKQIPVLFNPLSGKIIGDIQCQGAYTSKAEHSAVLVTSFPLKRFDNIHIQIPEDRFAKVIQVINGTTYQLKFTSD